MAGENTYYNLEHTSEISLRTYAKIIPSNSPEKDRKIIAEGAYRIRLCFSSDRLSVGQCFLTVGAIEFELIRTGLNNGVFVPVFSLDLGGDVTTVRDDEITCRFIAPVNDCSLIVLYDRVVWKKDDNFYPAQALTKSKLNELNQKKK